jgi:hypothetical protein
LRPAFFQFFSRAVCFNKLVLLLDFRYSNSALRVPRFARVVLETAPKSYYIFIGLNLAIQTGSFANQKARNFAFPNSAAKILLFFIFCRN